MTEHIAITVIILAAGGLTYLLRAAPVLVFQHRAIESAFLPHVRAGKLRVLGFTGGRRSAFETPAHQEELSVKEEIPSR